MACLGQVRGCTVKFRVYGPGALYLGLKLQGPKFANVRSRPVRATRKYTYTGIMGAS